MKGYYVKAKNLATGQMLSIGNDVHKGELAMTFGKEDGKPPAGQNGARTQFNSSLIES